MAVSFGVMHSGFSLLELSYYSLLGMLLAIVIYKKTDSIAMVIIIHVVNNTVGTLL